MRGPKTAIVCIIGALVACSLLTAVHGNRALQQEKGGVQDDDGPGSYYMGSGHGDGPSGYSEYSYRYASVCCWSQSGPAGSSWGARP